MTQNVTWGSRIGFILAGAGSAIGLGAIWKFPYWLGVNGGAAFLIPYIFFTFTVGVALLMAELAVGRAGRGSVFNALKTLGGPFFTLMGTVAVFTSYIILSYYSVVGGWCVKYLVDSMAGDLVTSDPKALSAGFTALVQDPVANTFWHFVFLTMTSAVVVAGVVSGIERVSKYLLPLLFVLMLFLIGRSLMLPGAGKGLVFLFAFHWSDLTWQSLLNAMGLTFFSLSLGCGIMVTYGAYLRSSTDIPSSACWIGYLAVQTSILSALMVMPAVFAMGQSPNAGPGLVFITLPLVFSQIPFGAVFAVLFYLCLLVAALTSAISLLEVLVAYMHNEWGVHRIWATLLCYVTLFFVGTVSALSFGPLSSFTLAGKVIFDQLDYLCNNILMPAGGLVIALLAGWKASGVFRAELLKARSHHPCTIGFLLFSVKVLSPLLVLTVLITGL